MIIRLKDIRKLAGISVITFCAVFVCNLFLNYNIDMGRMAGAITGPSAEALYQAQLTMSKITCAVSGGCLLGTSVVLLFFYISQYIRTHSMEMGILKAMGYSRFRIAWNFSLFGLSVLAGTGLGYLSSALFMSRFYRAMNSDDVLPDLSIVIHWELALALVLLPVLAFGLLAVFYAYRKLHLPALNLLRDMQKTRNKRHRSRQKSGEDTFLKEMRRGNVRNHPALVFFIAFGAFCYSDMVQMSASMKDLSSELMGVMIFVIGIVLAVMSLLLATSSVVNANAKNISIMKIYGYSFRECTGAVLNGYRLASYVGFLVGTVYQYGLMKLMMKLFADVSDITLPEVVFRWDVFWITLVTFLAAYELMMYAFSCRIKNMPVKKIMME
ncbi:ABC transporter permease [Anaerolentibacter hominis]|uniref:ABC transporter permease n=1 Tax=Anaerolentibacter hominis TaxID=3079009 RepID=UPI0031B871F4